MQVQVCFQSQSEENFLQLTSCQMKLRFRLPKIRDEVILSGKWSQEELQKKYRATRLIASMTNLDRKKLSLNNTKHLSTLLKKCSTNIMVQLASKVASFLSRDDNSRMMPGKKDGLGQIQNRVLNDYMKNLHLKFLAENPKIKVSTGTFSKLRPLSIRLGNFLSKNTCLCTKHQNFALKCKCLQSYKVTTIINPDSFIRTHDDKAVTDMLTNIKEENIVYNQWKRVKVDIGRKDEASADRSSSRGISRNLYG